MHSMSSERVECYRVIVDYITLTRWTAKDSCSTQTESGRSAERGPTPISWEDFTTHKSISFLNVFMWTKGSCLWNGLIKNLFCMLTSQTLRFKISVHQPNIIIIDGVLNDSSLLVIDVEFASVSK